MRRVVLPGVDPASLRLAVGATTYAKAAQYLRERAVLRMWWGDDDDALHGIVRGSGDQVYSASAHFLADDAAGLTFDRGYCTCPVGFGCKHVAALVLASAPVAAAAAPAAGTAETGRRQRAAAWERSLDLLLGPDEPPQAARSETPLAVELTLSQDPSAGGRAAGRKLQARLVHPGRSGGWVGGNLSWTNLDALRYHGNHPAAAVRWLQELHAMYLAGARRVSHYPYGYSYGQGKSIDLSAFESRQLWPMLDEAESAGVALVHARKLGPVERVRAELCLDVTGGDPSGAAALTPVLRVAGAVVDAAPVLFIGSEGHGLVYLGRAGSAGEADAAARPFRLAQLARPAPERLRQMFLAGGRLEVPAAERARFRDEYYLRLRRAAAVTSSDGSFVPPAISPPTLVLRAAYGPGHSVEVGWEWAYQVGDSRLRATTAPDASGYRDADAERAILAGLDAPVEQFGLPGPEADRRTRLAGIDTVRFTTELLPLLAGQPGVAVEVAGQPADYREAGDSLRISVSTEERPGETDWFDLGITISVEGRLVPFADVFTALSRGESHLLLPGGAYFSLDKPELQTLARLIEEAKALQDAPGRPLAISRFQAGLWEELTGLGVVSHQARAWQEQVSGLLTVGAVEPRPVPATLTAQLRPYQREGFDWLAFLWEHRLGGILADDMGLGKTLQSLALICHARLAEPGSPPFLVVAPTSVAPNWAAEAARFAPGLKVATISETQGRRGGSVAAMAAGADAVVTSYALLRIDFEAYAAMGWSAMILDEAQNAKNHQSKIYQCARRIPAPVKIAITGTPMENNLMELWSMLSITAPGLFPSPARFRDYYGRPIEKDGDAELLAQFRRRIRPLVKRRTKEQVATDLPAKQEQVLEVELHPRHRKLYQTHLQRERQKVLGLIDDLNANRFTILRSLTLLRQLSLHGGLVDEAHADLPSAKIDALVEQLRDVADGGHRALVFSQFTRFLDVVRGRLEAEGLACCHLDGKTRDRAGAVRGFREGTAPVFLISLKAGGFGLNLTEADYCFLLDPWWNPATEAQAVDRAHRIGQTRNVMVYRLIAAGTIEEKVMALQARKAELFASVMDSGNVFGAALDADDIRSLFD